MSTIVLHKQPCLDPECGSSDARQVYDNGSSFCFSCRKSFKAEEDKANEFVVYDKPTKVKTTPEDIQSYPVRAFKDRKIEKEVLKYYGVRVGYSQDGEVDSHYYPYDDEASFKVRKLPKDFYWVGTRSENLFGQTLFTGDGKRLIICEGEIDALSVAQAQYEKYQKFYPCVAISSASSTKSLLVNRDWIRSFGEVIIIFDPDEAGQNAVQEAIKIIGLDKVKIAKLPEKDPSDVLVKRGSEVLMRCIFESGRFVPSGFISKEELWDRIAKKDTIPVVPYPDCMAGVNTKLKGQRLNEITLFVSGTGAGKSSLLREIILNDLAVTDSNVGIISLEETPEETAIRLSGMALSRNPSYEEVPLEDLWVGFDTLFGSDRIILMDHEGTFSDSSIISKIEYMCLSGCRYIFIDHITILVSEGVENLSGNEAQDKMMAELLRIVKKYPVWIGLVSHLRKAPSGGRSFEEGKMPSIDDVKGSGSIKQISYDIIAFARNMSAEDEMTRNSVQVSVLKARTTSLTGPVLGFYYDFKTGRLRATEPSEFMEL